MSITEILEEVPKMSNLEREELKKAIEEAERQDQQKQPNDNGKPFITAFDLAADLIGKHDFGPGDLATNKEYLKDLGRD